MIKFNVGDKLQLKDPHFTNYISFCRGTDIITVTKVEPYEDTYAYAFKEDVRHGEPSWIHVEINFKLVNEAKVITDWREELQ